MTEYKYEIEVPQTTSSGLPMSGEMFLFSFRLKDDEISALQNYAKRIYGPAAVVTERLIMNRLRRGEL
jgi:hypothetical protein